MVVVAAACGISLIAAASRAQAATVAVDCTGDPGALTAGLSASQPGDQLLLKGRCVGSFVVQHDLTLRGLAGAVLDGGSNLGPVLRVAAGASVEADNLVITGGLGQDCIPFPFCPFNLPVAGIDNYGTLTLFHDTVTGMNHSLGHMSGIAAAAAIVNWAGAVMEVRNSSVVDNVSEADAVGPAEAVAGISNGGTMLIKNSDVRGNSATAWTDAVAGIWNSGALTISNSSVDGNTATGRGQTVVGGILNDGSGTLAITNGDVSGNSAVFDPTYAFLDKIAGGLYNASAVALQNTSVTGNSPTNCNFSSPACH